MQAAAPADLETASHSRSDPGLLAALAGAHASTGEGTATHLAARPLLPPDEAVRLPPDRQVLLRPGRVPALAGKLRHYEDPEFARLADG